MEGCLSNSNSFFRVHKPYLNLYSLTHNSTALTQLSAASTRITEENREHVNKIVPPRFTAVLCVKFTFRRRYVSEKPLLTHPFEPKGLASLWLLRNLSDLDE